MLEDRVSNPGLKHSTPLKLQDNARALSIQKAVCVLVLRTSLHFVLDQHGGTRRTTKKSRCQGKSLLLCTWVVPKIVGTFGYGVPK